MSDKLPRYREPDPEPKLDDCYCYWCEQEKPEDEMTQEPELCTACLDRMKERDRDYSRIIKNMKKWQKEAQDYFIDNKVHSLAGVLVKIGAYLESK